jgi:hypothetical protein
MGLDPIKTEKHWLRLNDCVMKLCLFKKCLTNLKSLECSGLED